MSGEARTSDDGDARAPAPSPAERARRALNWVNLSTPLGLGIAALTRTPVQTAPRGLYVGTGYRPRLPAAAAFTVGNVVLVRGDPPPGVPLHAALSPDLLAHEAAHATQYAALLGLPFLPAYGLAAVWSLLRTGDPASRNPFERGAGLTVGGYVERPVRPLLRRTRRRRNRVADGSPGSCPGSPRRRIRRRGARDTLSP